MLTARKVITMVVIIAVLSVAGMVIKSTRPPDRGGIGGDSYGTRAHGLRGVYEILGELQIPVERGIVPPNAYLDRDVCFVFWEPDRMLVQMEPNYLRNTAKSVQEGAAVVISPGSSSDEAKVRLLLPEELSTETTALAELGLEHVSTICADDLGKEGENKQRKENKKSTSKKGKGSIYEKEWRLKSRVDEYTASSSRVVEFEGELEYLGAVVKTLRVPSQKLQVIAPSSRPAPAGRLFYRDEDDRECILAGLYPMDNGEIIVVSDSRLFINTNIKGQDNAVLAAHLFVRSGKPLVFDEFYHGLTVRGNPAWLLTQHPYGIIAALIVAAVMLWAWRQHVYLGPPLEEKIPSRRTVGEYVDAMARLFLRSGAQIFILSEFKTGLLWVLRKRLGLSPKRENVEEVAAALGRRDKRAAESLLSGMKQIEKTLKEKKRPRKQNIVRMAREVEKCL